MKRLLSCTLLTAACCAFSLSGAQKTVARPLQQQIHSTLVTPSIFYPLVSTALIAFGITPNSKLPTRFRAPEEAQWFLLFAGCILLVVYLRKLANHIEKLENRIIKLEEERKELRTLLDTYILKQVSATPPVTSASSSSMSAGASRSTSAV